MGSSSLIVLFFAGVVFAAGGMAVARFFVKGTKNLQKGQAYECGIPTTGTPWNQFNIGYYLYNSLFIAIYNNIFVSYTFTIIIINNIYFFII